MGIGSSKVYAAHSFAFPSRGGRLPKAKVLVDFFCLLNSSTSFFYVSVIECYPRVADPAESEAVSSTFRLVYAILVHPSSVNEL
jgi:hypothetical protein